MASVRSTLVLALLLSACVMAPVHCVVLEKGARAEPAAAPSVADKVKNVIVLMLENRSFVRTCSCLLSASSSTCRRGALGNLM